MTAHRVRSVDGPVSATVDVPGSKSVANRALVCAALADGDTRLENVAPGDDTSAMIECLAALGVTIDSPLGEGFVTVVGSRGRVARGPASLHARLAGTTSRFVTAVAALGPGPTTIDGDPPLRTRPMTPLHAALAALGATVEPGERAGHLPVTVRGPLRSGGELPISGDISSQYITALMLIAPYLEGGLTLRLTTPLVSAPYVRLTAAVMEAFGAAASIEEELISVPEGRYRGCAYLVEPDASSASYPLAAAAIAGGTVHVPGLGSGSLQGDAVFAGMLGDMGCDVHVDSHGTTVSRHGPLRGIDVDMADISDLVPTLAVVAPFATTATTIRGVSFIRAKESDRIGDLCAELRSAGVRATEQLDGLLVEPGPPHPARFDTHHDHRLAMALALLGLVVDGVEVDDPQVVTKSWPAYWEMLEELQ